MDRSQSHNTNNGIGGLGLGLKSGRKRVSIMTGKPMPVMPATKRSKQYRRVQINVYNFLERPSGKFAGLYQLVMFVLTLNFLEEYNLSGLREHNLPD